MAQLNGQQSSWLGLADVDTPALRCPRCDTSFDCAAGSWGCWCGELELSPDVRARLAAEYQGCLCRECLRELATRR